MRTELLRWKLGQTRTFRQGQNHLPSRPQADLCMIVIRDLHTNKPDEKNESGKEKCATQPSRCNNERTALSCVNAVVGRNVRELQKMKAYDTLAR